MGNRRTFRVLIAAEGLLLVLPCFLLLWHSGYSQLDSKIRFWIFLPSIISVLVCMISLWFCRKTLQDKDPSILRTVFLVVPLAEYGFLFSYLAAIENTEISLPSLIGILLGLLLIMVGNILPKSEPNPFFGIRTQWTLASRENWRKTSRISGRLWVFSGFLSWAAILLKLPAVALVLLTGSALAPIGISWWIYRRQVQDGSWKKIIPAEESQTMPLSKPVRLIFTGFLLLVLVICMATVWIGKNWEIQIKEDQLVIESPLVSNVSCPLADIQSLILKPAGEAGRRIFGYAAFGIDLGKYQNSEYGNYLRYTGTGSEVIELKEKNRILVFSKKTDEETRQLFETLKNSLETRGIPASTHYEVNAG